MKEKVVFKDLGADQPYKEIWDLQESLVQEKVKRKLEKRELENSNAQHPEGFNAGQINPTVPVSPGTANHHLLFVEHLPVYTLGKSGDISNVLMGEGERQREGIDFFRINRGGDITFHGQGQLVGYPILDLEYFKTDLGWYLRSLEEMIILTMADYGLKGARSAGETGVWLDPDVKGRERKICAMGIRCSRWITMHGFALNVNTDLSYFNHIIPCGIQNKQVTSLQNELGYSIAMEDLKQKVKNNFAKVFNVEIVENPEG